MKPLSQFGDKCFKAAAVMATCIQVSQSKEAICLDRVLKVNV